MARLATLLFVLGVACWQAAVVEAGRKYQVWIGMEDLALGLNINRNYPEVLKIHPGDTVVFKQKAHDPHTVTFYLPPNPLPDLMMNGIEINPIVLARIPPTFEEAYNGSYYANSGVMALGGQFPTKWAVPFGNTLGEFKYACGVHGMMQSGSIIVVDPKEKIPSPEQIKKKILAAKANINKRKLPAYKNALKSVRPPVKHEDGTKTHYVLTGFIKKELEFLTFFKKNIVVKQGDKITWYGAIFHTITFLNGNPVPPLFDVIGGTLMFNPAIVAPAGGLQLSREGYINSGLIVDPTIEYTLAVPEDFKPGKIKYVCAPHVTTKMKASITVEKKKKKKNTSG